MLRKRYIKNTLMIGVKNYIESFKTLEQEINMTIPEIKPIEIGGKEVYPDYIFIKGSSTNQRKIKFVRNTIQTPLNELIEKYGLTYYNNLYNFTDNALPHKPTDRNYTIYIETDLTQEEIEIVAKYWENNSPVIINNHHIEFVVETTEYIYDSKDLRLNSVMLRSGDNEEINTLLENIRFETGNPRFYEEFKIELKDFQRAVETSPWF